MRQQIPHSDFFKANREKLLSKMDKSSLLIVHSNDEMPKSGGQFYPFRQNSDLYYLTGIEQAQTILCLCPGHSDKQMREIIFIETPSELKEIWLGHRYSKEEVTSISAVSSIFWLDDYGHIISGLFKYSKVIYVNESELKKGEIESRDARYNQHLKDLFSKYKFEDSRPLLNDCRIIKNETEIDLIKKACSITEKAFYNTVKKIQPGVREYELEAELMSEFIRNGSYRYAFEPIIASGKNACILHYTENSNLCNDGDLVLLDFGATYANYNADCSRTLPINGKFSKRQKQLYNSVLNTYKYALSLIKPGISLQEINDSIYEYIKIQHIELGLYSVSDMQNEETKNVYKKYFMHGIGHYLGIDVHDVGDKKELLKPGMVITCEPGIYIKEENIGIRIETDVVITENGYIDLMPNIPIEIDDIEKLMKQI